MRVWVWTFLFWFFCLFVFGINSLQQGFIAPAEVFLSLTKQCETQSLLQGIYILIRESTFASGPFFIISLKASSRLHGFSLSVRAENTEYRIIQDWGGKRTEILRGLWREHNHLMLGTEGREAKVCEWGRIGVSWRWRKWFMDTVGGSWGQEDSIRPIKKWGATKRQGKENKMLPDSFQWVCLVSSTRGYKRAGMMFLLFLPQLLVHYVAQSTCFLNISWRSPAYSWAFFGVIDQISFTYMEMMGGGSSVHANGKLPSDSWYNLTTVWTCRCTLTAVQGKSPSSDTCSVLRGEGKVSHL